MPSYALWRTPFEAEIHALQAENVTPAQPETVWVVRLPDGLVEPLKDFGLHSIRDQRDVHPFLSQSSVLSVVERVVVFAKRLTLRDDGFKV